MGANTKDGAQLTGLLFARRRRRRLINDLLAKGSPGAAAPDVFGDWLFDVAAGGAATIDAAGIASAEAIGAPVIASAMAATGISSGEAFGAASVSATVSAAGISGGEAVSAPDVSAGISAAGIASGEEIGAPGVSAVIESAGIASAEEIGQPVVSIHGAAWDIFVGGIASEELFGLATVAPYVEPEFIGGGAVTPLRFLPAHRIGGAGRIQSAEVFGRPLIAPGMRSARRRAREMRELSGRWI